MADVIGTISAVIALVDASIKIYESAQKDIKLSETFKVVRRRLPVILHTLATCKDNLESRKDPIPEDVGEALEQILDACEVKASNLRAIFEKVIPGENDTRESRYLKVLRRLGKGNKVEELMLGLTQDVQTVVNHNVVNSPINSKTLSLGILSLFVGRYYELDQITELLHPVQGVQEQRRVVLGGMVGIGKTQLSIAYANLKSQSGFYNSVFWLNAASETALKDSFRSIASLIFDIQHPQILESEDVIRRIHRWLSHSDNTRWLLLFDNYDDPDQFKIHDYYPHTTSHGAILVTTRRPDLVSGNILHVKPFKLENIKDSLMILQTRSRREEAQSDPHAKLLGERLAGFPLALATAGAYLQRSTLTFERYLQEYGKRWNIGPRRSIELQEYERTLYTTWDLPYARLELQHADAAKLLTLLAYFSNQSLWYELFRGGNTKESPEWLHELATDEISFQGVMGVLSEYQFLEVHSKSKTWSMHNCVHDWTCAALNKNINTNYHWYAVECVDTAINEIEENSYGHIAYSYLAGHTAWLVHQWFLKLDKTFDPTSD
ncbi:TPR repeat protein [Penicillium herquei]|nr:TPR repeat protein [Penicillium herquei]